MGSKSVSTERHSEIAQKQATSDHGVVVHDMPSMPPVQSIVEIKERTTTKSLSGPLPSPDVVQGYEAILPGAAERIFQLAEREQAHRHASETSVHEMMKQESADDYQITTRAQHLAFIIACLGLILAGGAIAAGHVVVGGVIALSDLSTIVIAFLYSTRRQQLLADQSEPVEEKTKRQPEPKQQSLPLPKA